MKKIVFLSLNSTRLAMCLMTLLMVLMTATTAWANPVGKEEAQQVAQQFMQRQLHSKGARRAPRMVRVSPADNSQAIENLYLFNASDGQGFVIVSGDDRTEPILGYSTCGSIDVDQMPENMRSWLQHYADQIAAIQQYGLSTPRRAMENCGEPIAPQLTTKWYQFPIYNAQCPMVTLYADADCTQLYEYPDGQGNMITAPLRAVTGCTTTALAQVLYRHKYPAATTAEIPGYEDFVHPETLHSGVTIWNKYSDAAIPAGTPIDWDNMVDAYDLCVGEDGNLVSVTTTEVQNNAIASLMHICAAAMNTIYGTVQGTGSAATDENVLRAAIYYLGLPNATACFQGFHNYQEWIQLLYDEVKAARCVLFEGATSSSGHSFVIDGYDKEDLFHINWGWSGRMDGYFRINDLTPSHHNYSKSQMFARGLYPGAPAMEKQLYASVFQSNATTLTSDQGTFFIPMSEISVSNEQYLLLNVQLGITIEGQGVIRTIPIDQGFSSLTFKNTYTKDDYIFKAENLADGNYLCYPCFRTSETEEWKACRDKEDCCLKLSVSGTTMTIENVKPFELKIVSSHPSTYEEGKEIEFTPTLKVERGYIQEPMVFACTPRDDNDLPSTSSLMPIRVLYECYSEGDTFEVPLILPALPVGKYTIVTVLSQRLMSSQLYNFDIVEGQSSISSQPQSPSSAGGNDYDLQGRKLNGKPMKAGLYISNGKKVVIK